MNRRGFLTAVAALPAAAVAVATGIQTPPPLRYMGSRTGRWSGGPAVYDLSRDNSINLSMVSLRDRDGRLTPQWVSIVK